MTTGIGAALEHYNEYGFAVFPAALPARELAPLIRGIERGVDARANAMHAQGKITNLHADEPYDKRLASLLRGGDMGLRQWDEVADAGVLDALSRSPGLLEALASVLGPDVSFSGDFHVRPKLPESTLTSFPWHQDSQYYGAPTKRLHIVTAFIPLVNVDENNGCLWVIPGSHRWGLLKGERGADMNIRTFDDVEQRGTPLPAPMKRGDLLLFTNLTFHASKLNLTDRVRWSIDLRYFATPDLERLSADEREALRFYSEKLQSHGRAAVPVRGRSADTHAVAAH